MKHQKLIMRLVFVAALLTMTAQTAWADTAVSLQQVGSEYYVNMLSSGTSILTLNDASVTTFKVYDDGGKDNHYAYTGNSTLKITVPIGYVIGITGTAKSEDTQWDYWKIYKGHVYSDGTLFNGESKSNPTSINVQTTGNKTAIWFHKGKSSYSDDTRNLELTVTLIPDPTYAKDIGRAKVSGMESVYSYTGSELSASYSVYSYIDNELLTKGTDYTETITKDGVETEFKEEGYYTLTITGKDSYFGSQSFTLRIKNDSPELRQDGSEWFVNMPYSGTYTPTLDGNIPTFKIYDDGGKGGGYSEGTAGNFSPGADGYLQIHAPSGYQVNLTGYVRTTSKRAYLTVYDGSSTSASTLCENVHGTNSSENADSYKNVTVDVTSSGEDMLLHFDALQVIATWDSEGLILTASIGHSITVADGITHGSISCENFWIKGSSTTIPLTVTPATGYRTNTVSYNDGSDHTLTPDVNGDYSFMMPDKKVTVNATFAPITYTVSFNANGGTGDAMAAQNFTYDAAQNLTANTYTRTGYTFAGWATTADGNVAYADGAEVSNLVTTQGANVELFATWTANTYYVRFNANEGTGTMDNEEFTYDAVAKALTANTFTRTGYTFAGWATAADGAVAYVDQAEVSNLTATANGIFDLYAKWKKLLTNTDITISIPSQEWTGNALTPVITVTDGTTTLNEGTDYTVTAPSGTIQNADDYTFTITGAGNYSGTKEATFTIMPKAVGTYGALAVTEDQNGKTATIDASLEATIEITSDVEINQVELQRSFTANQPATVMLPFSLGTGQTVNGGSFYKFSGVVKDGDVWKAQFTEVATLKANTPYLFNPSADGNMTFDLNNGTVTLNTTTTGESGNTTTNWEFHGTYQKVMWNGNTGGNTDPSDLDKTYGFAKGNGTTIAAGQFVHFAAGAWLKPMRCYLVYNGSTEGGTFQNARSMTRGAASTEELPQTITVVLLGSSGETTAIGTLDTKTGDITLDGWYTMDGRKLEGKPTKKGLYINNGRKIVIK